MDGVIANLKGVCDLADKYNALLIEGRGHELGRATSRRAVLEVLGGELPADWPSARITLPNAHGLHARPAKILAQLAKSFDGDIRVRIVDGQDSAVSAKSLSKLLSLGARRGQVLEFVAEPSIAEDALPAILAAIEEGLGEEVEPLPAETEAAPVVAEIATVLTAPAAGSVLQAIPAAPGIAVGPAHIQVLQMLDYLLR